MKTNESLKHARELRGWSQTRVAQAIETDSASVSRWERGVSLPYPHFRERLCRLFERNAEELGFLPVASDEPMHTTVSSPPQFSNPQGIYDPAVPIVPDIMKRLIGRERLFSHLKAQFRISGYISSSLHGLPGSGKTTLALALASDPEVQQQFPDGVLWAGLGPEPDISRTLSRWATLLGISPNDRSKLTTLKDWVLALRTTIGARRLLVIIDDAWRIEDALLLQVGGLHCAYVLTTRFSAIALQFANTETLHVPELSEVDSTQLLLSLVPQLSSYNPTIVSSLVQITGGLPLAIRLIGNYLRIQAQTGQARRLRAAIDQVQKVEKRLVISESVSPAEHPPSLASTMSLSLSSFIAVSDQHLSESAQKALHCLATFPAKPQSFAEQAALSVCQQPVEALDELVDAGLLETGGGDRYLLHQVIADYASSHIEAGAYERLIEYVMQFVTLHADDNETLELESSMIFTALDAALRTGATTALIQITCTLTPFLSQYGLYDTAERYLRSAEEMARTKGSADQLANVLLQLGIVTEQQGNNEQAETSLLEALTLMREQENLDGQVRVLTVLGKTVHQRGKYVLAEQYLQEGLILAKELKQVNLITRLLQNLASATERQGKYSEAERIYEEGLTLARQFEKYEQVGYLLVGMGLVAEEQGKYAEAERYYEEGLSLARQEKWLDLLSLLLTNMGVLVSRQGHYDQTERYYEEGLKLARQAGQRGRVALLLANLGALAGIRDDYAQSEAYLVEGAALARDLGHPQHLCILVLNLGELAVKQAEYVKAETYFIEALALARSCGMPWLVSATLSSWGEMYLIQQQPAAALPLFQEMQQIIPAGSKDLHAQVLYGLARVAAGLHQWEEARKQGEQSLAIAQSIGLHLKDEVQQWLSTLPEKP